jgi:SAM-dependent methyltransferase
MSERSPSTAAADQRYRPRSSEREAGAMPGSTGVAAPNGSKGHDLPQAYDVIGRLYSLHRRADPRIALQVESALGDARTVLDVGAGTGSYEPKDKAIVAAEPSEVMIGQRPPGSGPAVRSVAEYLPFATASFDAVLAIFTVHHWTSPRLGLREMRRVGGRVVILHFDPVVHNMFWLFSDYLPEAVDLRASQPPAPDEVASELGADRVEVVPVPADCTDGFNWAYWRRPEMYLVPEIRACISGIALLDDALVAERMELLRSDIDDGTWRRRHGHLLALDSVDGGLRLIVRE